MDPDKFQATLSDETLNSTCELKQALEMVALLEAQLKEMSPNLDSISEYTPLMLVSQFKIHKSLFLDLKMSVGFLRYRKKVSQYDERVGELNTITLERDDLKKQYDDWRKRRLVLFICLLYFVFDGFYLTSSYYIPVAISGLMSSWKVSIQYL